MKILILGVSGMLGSSLYKNLSQHLDLDVYGTIRSKKRYINHFFSNQDKSNIYELDVHKAVEELKIILKDIKPDVVINCIGKIPQKESIESEIIQLNSLLPHKISSYSEEISAKLIHFSTDCVFSGKKGFYDEGDIPDAEDLYGRSKIQGEVHSSNHLTIRTSIIGHEIETKTSLVEWFLSQEENISGYSRAIFSGFPCNFYSKILIDYIFPHKELNGILHISSNPISKFNLLMIVKRVYDKNINIELDENYKSDKSLDSSKFQRMTGFRSPEWEFLVRHMYQDYEKFYKGYKK